MIMRQEMRGKAPEGDAPMAVAKRFGRYKKESAGVERRAVAQEDGFMQKLESIWRRVKLRSSMEQVDDISPYRWYHDDEYFESVGNAISREGLACSCDDVTRFCYLLEGFQKEEDFGARAGLFLMAMVEGGDADWYAIDTAHLEEELKNLGHGLSKRLTLRGDRYSFIGGSMRGGEIHLEGKRPYMSINEDATGRIFHEGRLVYRK
jgi:hypothetical protein